FSLRASCGLRALHSFPTRRSSDLGAIADAHVALAAVGAERHEDDPRAFVDQAAGQLGELAVIADQHPDRAAVGLDDVDRVSAVEDRKSTRLNSSHVKISYAVFCLK